VYVHVSPGESLPSLPVSPVGPATVQPAIVSETTTVWKNPVPVAVTVTVKSTEAPAVGTAVGLAVFATLIVYVGGAAIAAEAAMDRSPAAAKTAAILVRLVMFHALPVCLSPIGPMDESRHAHEWALPAQG
jgi:hypothetical protein